MSAAIAMLLVGVTVGTAVGALLAVRFLNRPRSVRDEAWHDLLAELERARRYDHTFTLVRLEPRRPGDPAADELLTRIERSHRRTDRCWQLGDQRYLMLPETDKAGADGHLGRLLAGRAGEAVAWRSACFPDDGLTVGALLAAVQDHPVAARRRRTLTRARQEAS